MNPNVYRGYTPTMQQITMLSRMRITTPQEAVAYLRATQALNEQVAYVLQQASLRAQQQVNREITPAPTPAPAPAPTPAPAPAPAPEPEKKFEAEDLATEEGYSESEVEDKLAKLKEANEQPAEKEGN